MGALLRPLHDTHLRPGTLPAIEERMAGWIGYLEARYLDHGDADMMRQVVAAVPHRDTLLHYDFHEGNVMVADGELVLIDLDDVCVGNPLFDLMNHHDTHILISRRAPSLVRESLKMSSEEAEATYRATLAAYFGSGDAEMVTAHMDRMALMVPFAILVSLARSQGARMMSEERVQASFGNPASVSRRTASHAQDG